MRPDLKTQTGVRYIGIYVNRMAPIHYREIEGGSPGFLRCSLFLPPSLAGLGAACYMEHHGHIVTGMNNQVVWGTPHVFAVF